MFPLVAHQVFAFFSETYSIIQFEYIKLENFESYTDNLCG